MNYLSKDIISYIYKFISFKEAFNISMLNTIFYTIWRLHKFDKTLYIKAKNKHLIEKYPNLNFGMKISKVGDLVSIIESKPMSKLKSWTVVSNNEVKS